MPALRTTARQTEISREQMRLPGDCSKRRFEQHLLEYSSGTLQAAAVHDNDRKPKESARLVGLAQLSMKIKNVQKAKALLR